MPRVKKEILREQYPILYNETPSLTDSVYHDENDPFRDLKKKSTKKKIHQIMTRAMATQIQTEPLQKIPSRPEIIQKYHEPIAEHISRRINGFFLQLICCYKTNLLFEIGDTVAQGASVGRIEISGLDDKGKPTNYSIQRNAAHSNTLPCLLSCCKGVKEVFLKGTDAFRIWNSTINMPALINRIDIKIDGTTKQKKLRSKALDILNRASQSKITPVQGLEEFINSAITEVEYAYKTETNPEYKEILALYEKELKVIRDQDCDMLVRVEYLLNATVLDPALRDVVYEISYNSIREAQFHQNELLQKIYEVKDTTLEDILKTTKRKPDNFEAAFRSLLIEKATGKNSHRIEKLYNFSPHDFENRLQSSNLTKYKNTKKLLLQSYLKDIEDLSKELSRRMEHFREVQKREIGATIKILRKAKNWKVEDLAKALSIKKGELCEIERGEKTISSEMRKKCGDVLEVNLFTPDFFYN